MTPASKLLEPENQRMRRMAERLTYWFTGLPMCRPNDQLVLARPLAGIRTSPEGVLVLPSLFSLDVHRVAVVQPDQTVNALIVIDGLNDDDPPCPNRDLGLATRPFRHQRISKGLANAKNR